MPKIIRIAVVGIQSTGKSFLISGIKSVFNGNSIMDNLDYQYLEGNDCGIDNVSPIDQIEVDIKNVLNIGKGTSEYLPYIGEIINKNTRKTVCYLMIANMPGELFNIYYETNNGTENFVGFYKVFDQLLHKSFEARVILWKINLLSNIPGYLSYFKFLKLKNLQAYENDLWVLFESHLQKYHKSVYITKVINDEAEKVKKYFPGFVFSYLANQTYLCVDPIPDSSQIDKQNNLLRILCSNIQTNRYRNVQLNFVITKFDSLFLQPNINYLPKKFNSKDDYFEHVDKYLTLLSDLISGNVPKNQYLGIKMDKLKSTIDLLKVQNKLITKNYDNVLLPRNVFLTCVKNINHENERIPKEIKDYNEFIMQRFPIGCYELVYSMLLKTQCIQISKLGLEDLLSKNPKFVQAYLN